MDNSVNMAVRTWVSTAFGPHIPVNNDSGKKARGDVPLVVRDRIPFLQSNDFLTGVAAELCSTVRASVVDTLAPEFL